MTLASGNIRLLGFRARKCTIIHDMVPSENITEAAGNGARMGSRAILEDAVRLHQQGHLTQAERLYGEVLARDPGNADALHLLGMIGLQRGDARGASVLLRKAIALNGRVASYHFHHALALQSLNDMEGAVEGYAKALTLKPGDPDTCNNMGNALAAQGKLEEALQVFHRLIARQPDNALAHNNLGNVQRSLGRQDEAEASFRKAIALQPGYAGALVNLGNLHHDRNEPELAESCYRRAIALAPRDAAAHCGLGVALWRLGRHDEALACYRSALSLDPHHAGALVNLGNAHWERGALDEAEACHARALALRPRDCDILNSLAALRLARGDSNGADALVRQSLGLQETAGARRLFVQLARRADWARGDEQSRHAMTRALTEPWDRPGALARAAGRMIRSHPVIAPLVARAEAQWPDAISLAQLLGDVGFAPLADETLLRALLTSAPNMDIPLERFLTLLRGAMLRELAQDVSTDGPALLFASTLAQQCFINEYVFACGDDEMRAARALLETAEDATPMRILLAACYLPLHSLPGAALLPQTPWPPPVEAVLIQQIREPGEEARLRAAIPRLTEIEDAVSLRVREQYEESPYPRWVRQAPGSPDTIANFIAGKFPFARFDRNTGRMQDVLIAGCGTGQRAIAMAQKFGAQNILAVDLSLASLCYARRMSQAMALPVSYAQADLLELGRMGRQFDLIESLGVLHHLGDPWEGWRRLQALVRPGGFMLLGLYSESARRPITQARARIREQGFDDQGSDIRRFRQRLIQSGDAPASIVTSEDFFSLSACRDLLFHVQEQRTTLAELARVIESQGLHFLGFELDDAVLSAYRARFPQDKAATDLSCWQAFEADHPGLFAGMYVFWVQKPAKADPGDAKADAPLPSGSALLQSCPSGAAGEKPASPQGTGPGT